MLSRLLIAACRPCSLAICQPGSLVGLQLGSLTGWQPGILGLAAWQPGSASLAAWQTYQPGSLETCQPGSLVVWQLAAFSAADWLLAILRQDNSAREPPCGTARRHVSRKLQGKLPDAGPVLALVK